MNDHTKLSVNINKIATLRNARGGDVPNVLNVALDCEQFGAEGITVHPRPNQRHIRYSDVAELAPAVTTEFNIEGYPNEEFMALVLANRPAQVTLVPDPPGVLTSNAGWDAIGHKDLLTKVIATFKDAGIRTSIFIETDHEQIAAAKATGTDRIELYTEAYATGYLHDRDAAVAPFVSSAAFAKSIGLGVNAGHDLSLENLSFFAQKLYGNLDEVSIGHALISDALYLGLHNTIQQYRNCLNPIAWK
ncbi:pyridoxine 5'-phosphate synthase [Schleiferiaceae bacterium]|nr:pyridoxine 5'-phosphate synthase [Schleiferiaceae bacterium]MDA8564566.1 pyridoxine 5'-phosphate synthase [Schleiferiaceae bacterium]MDA9192110.1 pyridoxine 5'-phosphate synthase [Schleiferiaceae bacterium]